MRASILSRLLLAVALAVPAGGCAFQIGSLFGTDDRKEEITGSISAKPLTGQPTLPPEGDLAFAKAAAADVLAKEGTTASAAWENPYTGARGTVTPFADTYTQAGATCRDFLASYVKQGSEIWLQGGACRGARGKWEIRTLTPWKKG